MNSNHCVKQLYNENQDYDIVWMYNELKSINKISKIVKMSRTKVASIITQAGVKIMSPGEAGKIYSGKYSWDELFFQELSHDACYIIGLIMADGHIPNEDSRKRIQISLKQEDGYLLKKISFMLCGEDVTKIYNTKSDKWQDACRLTINNTNIANRLIDLGVTYGKKLGGNFINFNNDVHTFAFILGYFDGNGCIRRYKRIINNVSYDKIRLSFTSNYTFLKDLQSFLMQKQLIRKEKTIYNHHACSDLYISSLSEVTNIMKCLYNTGSSLYLTRKHKIVEDIV